MSATLLHQSQQDKKKSGGRPPVIAAVQHAIQVLTVFSSAEPVLGVNEIARRIGIHKSTVSRILSTLEDAHLVERDAMTGRFRLGAGIVALAGPLLSNLDVRDAALPYLQNLAATTRESVSLSIWSHGEAVNVEQVLGPATIRHIAPLGRRNPGHSTATGKVLLAHAPEAEIAAYVRKPLPRFTEHTIVEPAQLLAELARVRRLGYALNEEELELELFAVAAPVRDRLGAVVAAVSVSAPSFRVSVERRAELIDQVKQTSQQISVRIGYLPTELDG